MLGKEIRMQRLFHPQSGHFFAVMVDHFVGGGVKPGLLPIQEKLDRIVEGHPRAITMHKGLAEKTFGRYAGQGVSLVVKCTTPNPYAATNCTQVADVEEAVQLGADAVAVGGIFCGPHQAEQMEQIARIAKECRRWGMPLIGHIYPFGEAVAREDREDWQNIVYAARTGAELGVDILKIHHSGDPETFRKITAAVPAPVVVAGGTPGRDIREYFTMMRNVIDNGGAGVAVGRVAWNHPDIPRFLTAAEHIMYENGTVEEAVDMLAL